jgi:hypothetical protein
MVQLEKESYIFLNIAEKITFNRCKSFYILLTGVQPFWEKDCYINVTAIGPQSLKSQNASSVERGC